MRLHEVIRFFGYEKLREIDESSKSARDFDTNTMLSWRERSADLGSASESLSASSRLDSTRELL